MAEAVEGGSPRDRLLAAATDLFYEHGVHTVGIDKIIERAGVAKASLAGISMGGSLAQAFAGTHPERVERVILCDCTPRYTDEMRAMWAERAATATPRYSSCFRSEPVLGEPAGHSIDHRVPVLDQAVSSAGNGAELDAGNQ